MSGCDIFVRYSCWLILLMVCKHICRSVSLNNNVVRSATPRGRCFASKPVEPHTYIHNNKLRRMVKAARDKNSAEIAMFF